MALTLNQGYQPIPPDLGFVLPEEWVSKYLKSAENQIRPTEKEGKIIWHWQLLKVGTDLSVLTEILSC